MLLPRLSPRETLTLRGWRDRTTLPRSLRTFVNTPLDWCVASVLARTAQCFLDPSESLLNAIQSRCHSPEAVKRFSRECLHRGERVGEAAVERCMQHFDAIIKA